MHQKVHMQELEAPVACNRQSGSSMAKEWWCMVPVWSEADSQSYRLNEDQARRRQTEPGATDLAVTGHYAAKQGEVLRD